MDEKAQRERDLGEHVAARRHKAFGHKANAYRSIKIARATLDNIEAGRPGSDSTYRSIEEAFDWPAGSMRRFVDGRGPLPESPPDSARVIDRSHLTRQEALTLLWAATGAESDLDKIREVRRIEAEILGEVQ